MTSFININRYIKLNFKISSLYQIVNKMLWHELPWTTYQYCLIKFCQVFPWSNCKHIIYQSNNQEKFNQKRIRIKKSHTALIRWEKKTGTTDIKYINLKKL